MADENNKPKNVHNHYYVQLSDDQLDKVLGNLGSHPAPAPAQTEPTAQVVQAQVVPQYDPCAAMMQMFGAMYQTAMPMVMMKSMVGLMKGGLF